MVMDFWFIQTGLIMMVVSKTIFNLDMEFIQNKIIGMKVIGKMTNHTDGELKSRLIKNIMEVNFGSEKDKANPLRQIY